MARRATKDMYVLEPVGLVPGDDTVVRRKVFAGTRLADNWEPEEGSGGVEEYDVPTVGLGAAPHAYKEQLDDTGQVKDEHKPEHQRGRGRGRKSGEGSEGKKDETEVEAPAHVTAPKGKS